MLILLCYLSILFIVIYIIIWFVYNENKKKICSNSKEIKSQNIDKSKKFWVNGLKLSQEGKNISIKLEKNIHNLDYKTAQNYGGAFLEKTKDSKYKIVLIPLSANEGTLVHELLHIKLGDSGKEDKIYYKPLRLWFEIKANKELTKYKELLKKRKEIVN